MKYLLLLVLLCYFSLVTATVINLTFSSNTSWSSLSLPSTKYSVLSARVLPSIGPECEYYYTNNDNELVDGTFLRCYRQYYLRHRQCHGTVSLVPRGIFHQLWVAGEVGVIGYAFLCF